MHGLCPETNRPNSTLCGHLGSDSKHTQSAYQVLGAAALLALEGATGSLKGRGKLHVDVRLVHVGHFQPLSSCLTTTSMLTPCL